MQMGKLSLNLWIHEQLLYYHRINITTEPYTTKRFCFFVTLDTMLNLQLHLWQYLTNSEFLLPEVV